MSHDLTGLNMVITGAAAGIGAETARMAAARGAGVVVSDIDDRAGQLLVEAINLENGRAHYVHCDVADERQIEELVRESAERLGGLDVVHNNAGISDAMVTVGQGLEHLSAHAWDRVLAVNLRAPLLTSLAARPFLRASRNASIINAASIAATTARPHTVAYAASKAAVVQLTRSLALEFAADRIRVNCYAPGMIETQMTRTYLANRSDPDALRRAILGNYLTDRFGDPADVAEVVCFLASTAAGFVNGAMWSVDGGFTAWKATPDELATRRDPSG